MSLSLNPLGWPVLIVVLVFVTWRGCRIFYLRRSRVLHPGPETTVVDGPVRSDGTIDYQAVIHQHYSAGIAPDNNAMVLLSAAIGPHLLLAEDRETYFQLLGVSVPPAKGNYLVSHPDWMKQCVTSRAADDVGDTDAPEPLQVACERPWAREEFPDIAEWIDANERPLQLVAQASRRPQYYSPLVATRGHLGLGTICIVQHLRTICQLLQARAMLRLSDREFVLAWQDLLALHRLARFLMNHSTTIDHLVGQALHSAAYHGIHTLLDQQPPVAQVRQFLDEYLPENERLSVYSATYDCGERYLALDACQEIWKKWYYGRDPRVIDIDLTMRRCNQVFDEAVQAMRITDPPQSLSKLSALDDRLNLRQQKLTSVVERLGRLMWHSRRRVAEDVSDILINQLRSAASLVRQVELRAFERKELLCGRFALAIYRAAKGEYPTTLEQLVPEFLDEIPSDVYTHAPLQYRRQPDSYVLHSVGEDGTIDGETSPDSYGTHDFVVRCVDEIIRRPHCFR